MMNTFPRATKSCWSMESRYRLERESPLCVMDSLFISEFFHRESETSRFEEFVSSFMIAVRQPFTRKILLSPDPFIKCQNGL